MVDGVVSQERRVANSVQRGVIRVSKTPIKIDAKKRLGTIDTHRRNLSWGIVGTVLLLYLVVIVFSLCTEMADDRLISFIAALGGPMSLAGTIVGFYFGQTSRNNAD